MEFGLNSKCIGIRINDNVESLDNISHVSPWVPGQMWSIVIYIYIDFYKNTLISKQLINKHTSVFA